MKKLMTIACLMLLFLIPFLQKASAAESTLPAKWEELTAPDFVKAVSQSKKVCVIPLGIIEKHGPHMPLGTDLIDVRAQVLNAVKEEYAVVFPEYYVGQINEARHQPGVIAYSPDLVWKMLQETCNEISRNGFEKIIFVNGHGGNNDLLHYFCMSQLSEKRNYTVYLFQPKTDANEHKKVDELMKKLPPSTGDHAGATETSYMMVVRPDLVKIDKASTQSGDDLNRLANLPDVFTGIWWFAKFPNHYAGDAKFATQDLGRAMLDEDVRQLVRMIREVKADTKVPELQKQFYEASQHPLDTKQ
jgi:creatinine amidohydrolase